MTELKQDEEWRAAHTLDPNAYFLEVYRLLCHVLASPSIASVQKGFRGSLFGVALQQGEISRLLIHVASYYRVKYDDGSWEHAKWLDEEYEGVGILVEDVARLDTTVKLDFREACNKIIHARRVHFDGTTDTADAHGALNPVVHLYGEKRRISWKATVDLVAFCRAASNVIV